MSSNITKDSSSFDFKIDNHLNEDYIILMDKDSLNVSNKWVIIQKK